MVNYGTIYTLPFKSRKEVSYLIEIQKENYEGKSTELVGSGNSPFSVIIEDEDFLYTPTRFSSASIRIVGGDYLQNLYKYQKQTWKKSGLYKYMHGGKFPVKQKIGQLYKSTRVSKVN